MHLGNVDTGVIVLNLHDGRVQIVDAENREKHPHYEPHYSVHELCRVVCVEHVRVDCVCTLPFLTVNTLLRDNAVKVGEQCRNVGLVQIFAEPRLVDALSLGISGQPHELQL